MNFVPLVNRIRPVELAEWIKKFAGIKRQSYQIEDFRWFLDPASNFGDRMITDHNYEPHITAALMAELEPGDTFLDVGANEGWFSINAARRVGPSGRVITIEPQMRLWPVLIQNFLLNDITNYVLVPYAIGSGDGESEMVLFPSLNTGASGLVTELRRQTMPRQSVVVKTLDGLRSSYHFDRVKLMKIDVEGFELEVLRGARELLQDRVESIFVELHPAQLKRLGHEPSEVGALLNSLGFTRIQAVEDGLWRKR